MSQFGITKPQSSWYHILQWNIVFAVYIYDTVRLWLDIGLHMSFKTVLVNTNTDGYFTYSKDLDLRYDYLFTFKINMMNKEKAKFTKQYLYVHMSNGRQSLIHQLGYDVTNLAGRAMISSAFHWMKTSGIIHYPSHGVVSPITHYWLR